MLHCINIAKCRGVIFDAELQDNVAEIADRFVSPEHAPHMQLFCADARIIPLRLGLDLDQVKQKVTGGKILK